MQIREYEEYLNRRHAVCNGKEEDLDVLQNVNELFFFVATAIIVCYCIWGVH